jgi:ribosome recycling factor
MSDLVLQTLDEKLAKSKENLKEELNAVRAGRANPALLDRVEVDYYGTPTPIENVGNISTPDPKQIVIQPWEKSLLHPIDKAILAANLGFTPKVEADVVRIILPPVTEERRKDLCKKAKAEGETAKVSIRNVRRNILEKVKKLKDAGIPEDEIKSVEKEMQEVTDKFIKNTDSVIAVKEKEIMAI